MKSIAKNIEWHVVGIIALYKLCVITLIFFAFSLINFQAITYQDNFVYPPRDPVTLQTAYKTWDGFHYLFLSEKGYQKDSSSNAFSPLFPFFIHIGTFITHSSFWSGIIFSNICSFVAFYMFYAFVKKYYSEKLAYKSLIFFLAFPTAFFTTLIYSESLFLLLIMLFFYLLFQKKLFLSSLFALLLSTTRVLGILIFVPFLVEYMGSFHRVTLKSQVSEIVQKFFSKKTVFLLTPFVGFSLVLIFMKLATGDYFSEFTAQNYFVSQYSLLHSINITYFFHTFFLFPLVLHAPTNSILDRVFFVVFLLILFLLVRKVKPSLFVYAVCFGILPVLGGSFMSYMRYLSVVFPIYIVLAMTIQNKKYAFLEYPILFLFCMLQTLFIVMHALNYWVA